MARVTGDSSWRRSGDRSQACTMAVAAGVGETNDTTFVLRRAGESG